MGLGFIGKVHALAYHALPHAFPRPKVLAKVRAVLRSQSGADGELLKTLENPAETREIGEFFAQELDLVDICTPNALHLEQATAAAEHGLHIY